MTGTWLRPHSTADTPPVHGEQRRLTHWLNGRKTPASSGLGLVAAGTRGPKTLNRPGSTTAAAESGPVCPGCIYIDPPDPEGPIRITAAVTGELPGEALSVVFAVRPDYEVPAVRADQPSLRGKVPGQLHHIVVRRQFDPHLPGGAAGRHRLLPLSFLTGLVQSLLLRNGIGGWIVRRISPLLAQRAPELRPDARTDIVPREHLTRHLHGLISRSGAGCVQEDPGTPPARADRYLIAEAAAQCRDQRLLAGLQLAPAAERNADAPPDVHNRTIAALRTGTCTIAAADPLPDCQAESRRDDPFGRYLGCG